MKNWKLQKKKRDGSSIYVMVNGWERGWAKKDKNLILHNKHPLLNRNQTCKESHIKTRLNKETCENLNQSNKVSIPFFFDWIVWDCSLPTCLEEEYEQELKGSFYIIGI